MVTVTKSTLYASDDIEEQIIVTLRVNHEDLDMLSTVIRTPVNNFLMPVDDVKLFKLKDEYVTPSLVETSGKQYVNLNKLERANIKFDEESLAMEINFPLGATKLQRFNATLTRDTKDIVGINTHGAFMNYDLTFTHSSNSKYMSSLQDLNYFSEYGVLFYSFFIQGEVPNLGFLKEKNQKKIDKKVLRLESNWTFDNVEGMARWRVGDSITRGADWSGSTRFAGIQYSTNFSVKPDLGSVKF